MGFPTDVRREGPRPKPNITGMFELPDLDGALCAGHPDPNLFFRDSAKAQRERNKICPGCPVRDACETYGKTQSHGVWGSVVRQTD
jgi:hypothetical protein